MYTIPNHLNLLSKMKQSRKLIPSKDSFNEVKITKMLHERGFQHGCRQIVQYLYEL